MASVVAEAGKDASDLPLLETSAIPVRHKEGLSVQLVHLAHPKGNEFSRRKKQCDLWEFTWGTSIMLSRLLATLTLSSGLGMLASAGLGYHKHMEGEEQLKLIRGAVGFDLTHETRK